MTVETTGRRPFSVRMLADHWGCSESMVYQMINKGELRVFRLGGKLIRIAPEEVARIEGAQPPPQSSVSKSIADAAARRVRMGMGLKKGKR